MKVLNAVCRAIGSGHNVLFYNPSALLPTKRASGRRFVRGFTIIELVIVIGAIVILALVVSLVVLFFRKFW